MNATHALRRSLRGTGFALALAAAALGGCEKRTTTVQTPDGSVTTTTVAPTATVRQELGEAAAAASAAIDRAGPAASRVLERAEGAAARAASDLRESASSGALARAASAASSAMTRAGDVAADAAITARVKTALLADARVKGLQIDVDTHDRAVTLTASADARPGLEAAVAIARGVDGVASVASRTAPR